MALAALLIASCSSEDEDVDIVGTWKLTAASSQGVEIAVPNETSAPGVTPRRFWVRFKADGTLTGDGACNRFAGTYTFANNSLKPSNVEVTVAGCPQNGDLEILLVDQLGAQDNRVTIHDSDQTMIWTTDEAVLTFTRQQAGTGR